MAAVKLQLPGTPDGAEVEVPEFGTFLNGSTNPVEDWQVDQWLAQNEDRVWPKDGTLVLPESTPDPAPVVDATPVATSTPDVTPPTTFVIPDGGDS